MSSNRYISLEEAKISIITALNQFHPELGRRASQILYNDKRMNIIENPDNKTGMMMCRPSGLTLEHLRKNDMYLEDFERRFSPFFTKQDNPEDYAIIDYEYDGSSDSVTYLAHELGHAISDDIQNENGRSYEDFTPAEAEEQAYFVQNIYTHYTRQPSAESSYQDDLKKGTLKISWERACQYRNAQIAFERGLSMNMEGRRNLITQALGGHNGPKIPDFAPGIEPSSTTNPGL